MLIACDLAFYAIMLITIIAAMTVYYFSCETNFYIFVVQVDCYDIRWCIINVFVLFRC